MGAPVEQKDFIERQLKRYRELLANFTKRNKEIYFRPGKATSLNLSAEPNGPTTTSDDHDPGMEIDTNSLVKSLNSDFSPITTSSPKLSEFITNRKLDLTEHLGLRVRPDKAALKRLEKLRTTDNRYQKEFGISGAWLLGPFVMWRQPHSMAPDELMISPILKIPVDLEVDGRKHWQLKAEDSTLATNPSLRIAMNRAFGIQLPESFETSDPTHAINTFCQLIAADSRKVEVLGGVDAPRSLPAILSRRKPVKDDNGNIIDYRPTSVEMDLSERDAALHKKVSEAHLLIIDIFYIDHISATRLPLFQDYEKIIVDAGNHPIIGELLTGHPAIGQERRETLPRELDRYKERENYFVVPTDSTQHAVINVSQKASAIVVQGPPGTGKSQTITNMIADKIAKGKKVLFVAEKRAALDVVYTRLKQAGIDRQAILIHSSEMNRNELYASFLELADSRPDSSDDEVWQYAADKLDKIKDTIHEYYDASMECHKWSGLPACEIMALHAAVAVPKQEDELLALVKFFAQKVNAKQLDDLASDLDELQILVSKVNGWQCHPWRNRRRGLVVTATIRSEFNDLLDRAAHAVENLSKLRSQVNELFPGLELNADVIDRLRHPPESASYFDTQHLISSWTNRSNKGEDVVLSKMTLMGGVNECIAMKYKVETLRRNLTETAAAYSRFNPNVDLSLVTEMAQYHKVPPGPFAFLTGSFWRAKRITKAILKNHDKSSTFVHESQNLYSDFIRFHDSATDLKNILRSVGLHSYESNDETSESILRCVDNVLSVLADVHHIFIAVSELSKATSDSTLLSTSITDPLSFLRKCMQLQSILISERQALSEILAIEVAIDGYLSTPRVWSSLGTFSSHSAVLREIKDMYDRLEECDLLDKVDLVCSTLEARYGVKSFADAVLPILIGNSEINRIQERWGIKVKRVIARAWYDDLRTSQPALRGFDRSLFETKIESFKSAEAEHSKAACIAVNHQVSSRLTAEPRDTKALSLLKKESTKQRRVLYPREIMERGALATMMNLKSCWLMSPLSVSQILPLVRELFDVIIFDEASQVRVEDAIPSIYRAKSMVVVGDPKQMPPTNFFLGTNDADDNEDDSEEEVAESILDLASRVYPTEMLQWHYRSRSEALIAFSNRAFYGGRLIAPPNPMLLGQDESLNFTLVKDAFFTHKLGNVTEAEKVIEELAALLRNNPDKSVGVIAMGQSQRDALEAALERRMEKDSAFAEIVKGAEAKKEGDAHIGLFIKNLENVQGDERDIILISVGYAPTGPGRKLIRNFGPLSKTGGGRRLNVAITRAKEKVHVFCSFDPNEIPTDEQAFANNPDATCFGRYLQYTKAVSQRQIEEVSNILNSFGVAGSLVNRKSSRFSKDVARRLGECGYQVSLEIGSSGFFIDIGVHHPSIPGNFILGIECDGAVFHSTPYARDRDRAREALLKSRGWRIVRVWGPDWSRNWASELNRIETAIKELSGSGYREIGAKILNPGRKE